ncbi:hypothetical protein [Planomonospora sphaerica]|nr:hypothetical protein [Planomonospora sphaerica]
MKDEYTTNIRKLTTYLLAMPTGKLPSAGHSATATALITDGGRVTT